MKNAEEAAQMNETKEKMRRVSWSIELKEGGNEPEGGEVFDIFLEDREEVEEQMRRRQ